MKIRRKKTPPTAGLAAFGEGVMGWLAVGLFWFLAALNLTRTALFWLVDPFAGKEKVFFGQDMVWPALLFAAAWVVALAAAKPGESRPGRGRGLMLWVFGLGLLWLAVVGGDLRADAERMSEAAAQWIEGDFTAFEEGGYLYRFPYQLGYGLLLEGIYRLFGTDALWAVRLVNLGCVALSFWALWRMAALLLPADTRGGASTRVLLFGAVNAVLYATFAYGNLPGMALGMAALYSQLRWQRGGHWGWMALSAVCIGFSIWFKTFGLIFLIAQCILLVLEALRRGSLRPLAGVLAVLVLWQGVDAGGRAFMERRLGYEMNEGGPMLLTIAMGMQTTTDNSMAEGWFNGYNHRVYREAGWDEEASSLQAKADIAARLAEFAADKKMAARFYWNKTASQWAEPTYQCLWLSMPISKLWSGLELTAKEQFIFQGPVDGLLESWMDLYQSMVWLMAAVYLTLRRRHLDAARLSPALVVLGGFLFQLLWEAKSQYNLPYFLLAVPYASAGVQVLADALARHRSKGRA